ncbi:FecR family protein [Chitinophaga niabensis]|uniref:Ferric-dicitrate binding protein FerR, regulates iron transport through sigma-19 n=1 Tax=Chitinophaga niabensis TaxID=536979 RepID=A0A1N6FHG7_9BACT|nr:FecR domain-containing protein [Chitinophaga niabensis]SIN94702.1 ferric-dicitrate binding protein FerR, regulates iron transport through sigma-19 [Chitinophaga niabensis]
MNQERIDQLLTLYGRNECTTEELAELHTWYQQLETNQAPPFMDDKAAAQLQARLWEQLNTARQPTRVFRLPIWARVAAVALLLAGAAFWLLQTNSSKTNTPLAVAPAPKKISIPYGATKKIQLPDGTEVWLNAGSELLYAADFNTSHRTVQLSGEAFFDVKKDAERPFIINTGKMNIRVLGTAFNVKAYPEDKTSEASLIRGAIEVSMHGDPEKKFILRPNEKIVFPNRPLPGSTELVELQREGYALSNVSINPVDNSVIETAWTNNRLAFMNERFGDIAQQLERKFEVKLHFEDSTAAGLRFTATFEDEDIRETLEALQYSLPFNFRIEKKDIYITR